MADTITLPVEEIITDEQFYPRKGMNWLTAYSYRKAMEAGDTFPNIVVCLWKGRYVVVDGFHRLEAHKSLGKTELVCDLIVCKTEREIFGQAVNRNAVHGRPFSSEERVKIILTLQNFGDSLEQISHLVRIPTVDIEPFVAKRTVRVGDVITPIKSPLRHLAGTAQDSVTNQQTFNSHSQLAIVAQLQALITNGWLDLTSDLIKERIVILYQSLGLLLQDRALLS